MLKHCPCTLTLFRAFTPEPPSETSYYFWKVLKKINLASENQINVFTWDLKNICSHSTVSEEERFLQSFKDLYSSRACSAQVDSKVTVIS